MAGRGCDDEPQGDEHQEVRQGGASPAGDSKLGALVIDATLSIVNLRLRLLAGVDPDAVTAIAPLLDELAAEIGRLPKVVPIRQRVGFRLE